MCIYIFVSPVGSNIRTRIQYSAENDISIYIYIYIRLQMGFTTGTSKDSVLLALYTFSDFHTKFTKRTLFHFLQYNL